MKRRKAAVWILLGQSNAVGHGLPMTDDDIIRKPLENVYGLHRNRNQSFDSRELVWENYISSGMNLAEEQDNTYSIANCLAKQWQMQIDRGNPHGLPDLYIIQIAIGAEGVTEGYMWHPDREPRLIPGMLGTVDISLFPFSLHIFRLLAQSFAAHNTEYDIIGVHWRGGENDVTQTKEYLSEHLEDTYAAIIEAFGDSLGTPPLILHRIVCPDRMLDMDPTGKCLENMHEINRVFDRLQDRYRNVTVFDPRSYPQYEEGIRGNGLFIEDMVHFSSDVNQWIANRILEEYIHNTTRKDN